jgi:hypothetical protein
MLYPYAVCSVYVFLNWMPAAIACIVVICYRHLCQDCLLIIHIILIQFFLIQCDKDVFLLMKTRLPLRAMTIPEELHQKFYYKMWKNCLLIHFVWPAFHIPIRFPTVPDGFLALLMITISFCLFMKVCLDAIYKPYRPRKDERPTIEGLVFFSKLYRV